jgi:tetratricopeptide (TPR) repeat protein
MSRYSAPLSFSSSPFLFPFSLTLTGNWDITTKLSLSYYNLAVESFNSSEYLDCKLHIEGAIALNPKIHEYFSLKGKAEYYLGEYHEAYEDYKRCLQLNPENEEIRMRLLQFDKEMNLNDLEGTGGGREGGMSSVSGLMSGSGGSISERYSQREDVGMRRSSHLSGSSSAPSLALGTTKSHPTKVSIALPSLPSSALPDSVSVSYCTSLLPSINPYLAQTMISSELLKERRKELNNVIHGTRTNIEEKNELWKILEDVKLLAGQYREPLKLGEKRRTLEPLTQKEMGAPSEVGDDRQEEDDVGDGAHQRTITRGESGGGGDGAGAGSKKSLKKNLVPVTAIALKRRSEEISRQARLNPLVRGISSTPNDHKELRGNRTAPLPISNSSPFRGVKLLSSSHRLGRGKRRDEGGGESLSLQSHSQLLSLSLSSTHQSNSGVGVPKRVIRVIEQD